MDRRTFLQTAALPGLASAGAQEPDPAARPNVIWLIADQHRAQALGCNGDLNARTPNLDNLAGMGVNFTMAVSGSPACCPFRGSLLAGRYPHGCIHDHEIPLPAGQETIARPFNDAGYHTAYFGKWHLDGFQERTGRAAMHIVPPERRGGFETWAGYDNNNSQWDSWVHGGVGRDAFHYRLPGYETDALTDLLIAYIKERGQEAKGGRGRPFFAVLSAQPPHDPYVAPAAYMRNYNGAALALRPNVPPIAKVQATARRDMAGYYAMIENWDHNVGRIREALAATGLAFNTHILYFSDHGDMHGAHGQYRKAKPHEESIRIPFLIGGELPAYYGRKRGRFPAPVNHVDIAPTTLGLCDIPKPEWMAGTDYSHYRIPNKASAPEPDSAFLQWRLASGTSSSYNTPWRGIVTTDGWKYACVENASYLMFNLQEDPYELANLAFDNGYRPIRKRLIERLKQWIDDTGDKFALPVD